VWGGGATLKVRTGRRAIYADGVVQEPGPKAHARGFQVPGRYGPRNIQIRLEVGVTSRIAGADAIWTTRSREHENTDAKENETEDLDGNDVLHSVFDLPL